MRNRICLLTLFLSCFFSTVIAQNVAIDFKVKSATVKEAMQQFTKETGYSFIFSSGDLNTKKKVTINVVKKPISKVVELILVGQKVNFEIKSKNIIIQKAAVTKQTTTMITATGQVVDSENNPIIGATILEKGTANGTITDLDGNFKLKVPTNATILVRYIGYTDVTKKIKKATPMAITMMEDAHTLNEVVVVGYGVQKKVNMTGAVSMVDADKLSKNRPVTNIASALQGALPGVQITNTNNQPGSSYSFNVRGITSINGGSPLILVDNNPVGDVSMLNPNDIASVTVLKDAASASIYGARAAYGVILITTKKAKKGQKLTVDYANNFSFSTAYNLPDKASTTEYIKLLKNVGLENHTSGANIDQWLTYLDEYKTDPSKYPDGIAYDENGAKYGLKNYDMLGDMMESYGFLQKHDVSVQGADERNAFRVGVGYSDEDGILQTDKDSYTRTNLSAYWKSNATDWLKFETDIKYANAKQTYVANTISGGLYGSAISSPPFYTLGMRQSSDGEWFYPATPRSCLTLSAPLVYEKKTLRILERVILNPFKGMVINGEYTYLNTQSETENYLNKFYTQSDLAVTGKPNRQNSSYTLSTSPSTLQSINVYGNYTFKIHDHAVKLMGGFNQESKTTKNLKVTKLDVIADDLPSISQSTGELTATDGFTQYATRSLFYRLNYSYKDRYLFETNGRYDGSSRFPSGHRFGFFPSVSAGWRLSEEPFMKSTRDWLSNAKLRGSIGMVGNQNIGNYDFMPGMSSFLSSWLVNNQQVTSLGKPSLVSSSFTWEKVTTYNIGLDVSIFHKLSLNFDTYIRDTKDMLAPGLELPAVLGANAPKENVADLRTKGWELSMQWKDKIQEVDYNIGFNLSDSKAKITKFNNEVGLLSTNSSGVPSAYRVGKDFGEIWGYQTVRLYQEDDFNEDGSLKENLPRVEGYNPNVGDVLYKDMNGDGLINKGQDTQDNPGDMVVIGNQTRRYRYSVYGGASWKSFRFSFNVSGIGKRDIWLSNALIFPYYGSFSNLTTAELDYWTPDNPNAFYPRMYENEAGNTKANRLVQSRYLTNGAYCQIKNILLEYSLPKKTINQIGLSKLSFFINCENLYTFYHTNKGVNPESSNTQNGFSYPEMRKFSIGLNLTL